MTPLVVIFVIIGLTHAAPQEWALNEKNENTLVLSHVIFRHGSRTPDTTGLSMIQNNPWENNTYEPYGYGELTLEGKRGCYQLGKDLRQRYGWFLGTTVYQTLVDATTSSYNRCQMSLQSVLAGLFAPEQHNKLDPTLNWQPVVFKTIPFSEDNLISTFRTCPKALMVESDFSTYDEKTLEMYEYLRYYTKMPLQSSIELLAIDDVFHIQEDLGYPVPEWIKPYWPDQIRQAALQGWQELANQKASYGAGNLMWKIFNDTKAKIEGTFPSGRKLVLYSGHDFTIANSLAVLGNYNKLKINFRSHIMLELHLVGNQYGIKAFFQNYDGKGVLQLELPGCGSFCTIEQFERIVEPFYPAQPWCS